MWFKLIKWPGVDLGFAGPEAYGILEPSLNKVIFNLSNVILQKKDLALITHTFRALKGLGQMRAPKLELYYTHTYTVKYFQMFYTNILG